LELPPFLSIYTIENPTMDILNLDFLIESSDDCAFSGPRQVSITLMPFTSYDIKVIILPLAQEGLEWTRLPRLTVIDEGRKRVLEMLKMKDYLKMEGPDLYLRMPAIS
jgi:trafficking protein particle complex subunit 11